MNLVRYYFFFFYFSAVYQLTYYITATTNSIGLRDSFYVTFIWLIPLLFIPKYSRIIAAIIGVVLWMASLFNLGYFILYSQEFSQSVIFIMFESNVAESSEYLATYFRWWMILIFILYSILPYYLWKSLKIIQLSIKSRIIFSIIFLGLFLANFISAALPNDNKTSQTPWEIQLNHMKPATPWNIILGYIDYKRELDNMQKLLDKIDSLSPVNNLTEKNKDENKIFVLVIGESTNSKRMSLYGYKRDTTPRLKSFKNQLIVFNNVFAPRPYTIEVLQQALTFADEKNPTLYLKKQNLINIMKQAGYETFWITNQQTQTKRNTMLTTFSKMTDHQIYLNNNRSQGAKSFDEIVLPPYEKILKNKHYKKKFIIVHLIGTHLGFVNRFPKKWGKFSGEKAQDRLNAHDTRQYNNYDNAILYNDYVVSELIKKLSKKTDSVNALLYFSDHGHEVYDDLTKKEMLRSENAPTCAMYSVPFIIYGNKKWLNNRNIKELNTYTNRLYSSSDLFYTFLDITNLKFDSFQSGRSIINSKYEKNPVYIGNPYGKKKLRDLRKKPF